MSTCFGDFVATLRDLRQEPALLLGGIVEFREAVSDLHARDVDLESLGQRRIVGLLFRQRRNVGREIVKDRRLNEMVLGHGFEQAGQSTRRR